MVVRLFRRFRDRVVGEGDSGISWSQVTGEVIGFFRYGFPQAQLFEDFADDCSLIDDRDEAQGVAASDTATSRPEFSEFEKPTRHRIPRGSPLRSMAPLQRLRRQAN